MEVTKHNQKTELKLPYTMVCPHKYRTELEIKKSLIKSSIRNFKVWGFITLELDNQLIFLNNELAIMEVELKDDIIYLPNGDQKTVHTIGDILYYEGIYGKTIYERPQKVVNKTTQR